MIQTRTVTLLLVMTLVLVACGGAPQTATNTSVPAATAGSTSTPTAPAAQSATAPSATLTSEPVAVFEGLSSGLDNAKHARIRIAHAVMAAPNVDVYINGMPAVNGGRAQQNIGEGQFSGWLYVDPGTYTVTLVPHGETMNQALFAPVAVEAAAGKRYTVVMIGQLQDQDVRPLVVDELAVEAAAGAKPTDNLQIDVNNLKGAAGIDETIDGKPAITNVPYGEARAWVCNQDNAHLTTRVTGKPDMIIYEVDIWCETAWRSFVAIYGTDPTTHGSGDSAQGTVEMGVLDFLTAFNSRNVVVDGHVFTFNTVLAAIDTAGMRDQFANGGPYLFLPPTDEAFAALPKDQLDALLNDPQTLRRLLNAHFVDGYYPWGSISGVLYGQTDREVTNRLGQKLRLLQLDFGGIVINMLPVQGINYTVGNGNHVHPIEKLLPVQ